MSDNNPEILTPFQKAFNRVEDAAKEAFGVTDTTDVPAPVIDAFAATHRSLSVGVKEPVHIHFFEQVAATLAERPVDEQRIVARIGELGKQCLSGDIAITPVTVTE